MGDHADLASAATLPGDGGGAAAGDRLAAGHRAGDYEVERFVGAGAMGDVYAGRHPLIGKQVAIKVIKRRLAASPSASERFLREARAVNQVGHPRVVDVFAVGRLDDGRLYLVMDLLVGESLRARLQRGPLPAAEALAVLGDVAGALDAAHARGVVHRDLKPDNVFLVASAAGPPAAHVLDFGIAKLLAGDGVAAAPSTLTAEGAWVGTPAYMAPEQWGADGAGPASDRYALGVMAFELLAGQPPFAGGSLPQLMEQHFRAAVPSLSTMPGAARALPAAVDRVLARAMGKSPQARFDSGQALVEALREAVAGRRPEDPGTGARRPWLAASLGVVTLGAGVATAVVLLGTSRRAPAPAAARAAADRAAAVDVSTEPPGARIALDGADRGVTPVRLALEPGQRAELRLDKPGYAPVRRTVIAGGEPLRVALSPVVQFQGVWALPDGALRELERRGEQVALYGRDAAAGGERRFLRFFEFVPGEPGLVTFVAAEEHVDPRAPDEPSCHVPLQAEYRYDPVLDQLARRLERLQLDFDGARCALRVREWGDLVAMRRVAGADTAAFVESTAGSAGLGDGGPAPSPPPAPSSADDETQAKGDPPRPVEKKPRAKTPPAKRPPGKAASVPGSPASDAPARQKPVEPADNVGAGDAQQAVGAPRQAPANRAAE